MSVHYTDIVTSAEMCVTKFVTFESDLDVCKILLLKLIHEADEAAVNWLTTYGS